MTLDNLIQALKINNMHMIKRFFEDSIIIKSLLKHKNNPDIHVTKENKDIINKLEDDDGTLLYDGEKISSAVSAADGNAIEEKPDGLYVGQDKGLANKVNQIKQYQKYLNTELEFGTYSLAPNCPDYTTHGLPVKDSRWLPLSKVEGNMEDTTTEGLIKLHAGKKYNITYGCHIMDVPDTYVVLLLKNATQSKVLQHMYIYPNSSTWCSRSNESSKSRTYCPTEDCYIGLYYSDESHLNNGHNNGAIIAHTSLKTFIVIQEIGHEVVIDPMEYVNDQQGLEDTPVGHILSYMGNTPPKHYLNCDGSTYDIIEYPYLAEHIREQFGSYNYFGGDGVNTFAVPDLRGEFLRGTGENSHTGQGNGANVGKHQNATRFGNYGVDDSNRVCFGLNKVWDQNIGSPDIQIQTENARCLRLNSDVINYGINSSYTSRPTNTSVMYCIKYEPTYYFQHTTHTTENVVKEITTVQEISSLEYLQKHADLESGEPVGHILSYMGKTAPKHYLACDGTVYNISEYPLLAEHIKSNFGKYNYFGGNGTTTFAVPDLKGEFLRGTGLNSHTGNGNGAGVGSHQDATVFPNYAFGPGAVNQNTLSIYTDKNRNSNTHNCDSAILQGTLGVFSLKADTDFTATTAASANQMTARPTSTSVLWCIKCEPTYAFCEPIEHNNKEILDKFTEGEEGLLYDGKKIATDIEISKSNGNTLQKKEDGLFVPTPPEPETHSNKDTLDKFSESEGKLLYNGSEVSSETKVSEDENNAIQKKDDGLFVAIPDLSKEGIEKSVDAANSDKGIEEAPVGHILAYMGNTPPKHYLNCDGTVYSITEYNQLAEHIKTQFGSYNYFGGNGTTTFAVPDLRGEFLRGSGTNTHTGQGSGSATGSHQDSTYFPFLDNCYNVSGINSVLIGPYLRNETPNSHNELIKNYDSNMGGSFGDTERRQISLNVSGRWSDNVVSAGGLTVRPTNTSVMYCIKYESTYCLNFSYTEQITKETTNEVIKETRNYVGRGEEDLLAVPVGIPQSEYNGSVTNIITLKKSIEEFDEIEIIMSNSLTINADVTMSQSRKVSDIVYNKKTFELFSCYKTDAYISTIWGFTDNRTLGLYRLNFKEYNPSKWQVTHVYGIKYAKIGEDEISDSDLQQAIADTIEMLNGEE